MQAKKRYILVFLSCAFLAYCYFGGYRLKRNSHRGFNGGGYSSGSFSLRHIPIDVPNHMPSYLSASEYHAAYGIYTGDISWDDGLDVANDGRPDDHEWSAGQLNGAAASVVDTIDDVITAAAQLTLSKDNSDSVKSNRKHSEISANRIGDREHGGEAALPLADAGAVDAAQSNHNIPSDNNNNNNNKNENFVPDRNGGSGSTASRPCRMDTCFDYTKCYEAHREVLVYVYPPDTMANAVGTAPPPISLNYQKILSAITESRYYTADPERACLFVLSIDTLDRDSLSDDYVRNVPSRLQRLPYWNNGRNHVIFNLYSGTWPDYAENSLGFDTGEAILAKASMSVRQIRQGFDISIPLFHKQHPLRAGNNGFVSSNNFPTNKKYLLAFKGKR